MQIRGSRFEINDSQAGFEFGAADRWRVLVTADGAPLSYVELADPGATSDPRLTALALRRAGEIGGLLEQLVVSLARRIGAHEPPAPPRPSVSVVICTHRRPQLAEQAIAALAALDPAADEIIVVDNDPGAADCRAIAERAGGRYVREERRGQNRARATGLAHATCELVAFVDDDVVVSPAWLRPLAELFADVSIGAATGVAIGRRIETTAQNLRESFAGFVHGMRRRDYDWTNLRPLASGTTGAGANMIFRRELLVELRDAFPAELDGGTPTRSGGDLYALYRVLAAGRRITFDPRLFAEHEHPPDDAALRETVLGYGMGFSAFLAKALVEHRELTAPLVWSWLPRRLLEALLWQPLVPYPGRVALRYRYLLGGLRGGPAWLRSRPARATTGRGAPLGPRNARRQRPRGAPSVTLIYERSAADRNRAAREAADLLLFLEPDCSCAEDLAERHAARHAIGDGEGTGRIVLGLTQRHAASSSLATQLAQLWWQDHFNAKLGAAALTFADMTASNVSMPRALFERLGGFDVRLGPQAAAHELALRALTAGVQLEYEPEAVITLPLAVGTRELLSAARSSGEDHARIASLHPVSAAVLPAVVGPCDMRRPRFQALLRRLPLERSRAVGAALADVLERARLRGTWLRMFRVLAAAEYARGYAVGRGPRCRPAALTIDVASSEPIPEPTVAAPEVEVFVGARRVATFRPAGGQWGRSLARQVAARLDPEAWRRLGRMTASQAAATAAAHAELELDDTLVVFGPANHDGDDRHGPDLTAAGARVLRLGGHERDHWTAIAAAIADATEPHAAVLLPGVSGDADWLATARAPLVGDRVALACGTGVPSGSGPLPTILASRAISTGLYERTAIAPQFAVLSTRRVAQLGGIDPSTAAFGMHAPLIDLIERALDAGLVVAHQETPGIRPPGSVRPARSRLAWERGFARGGLLARAAVKRGPIRGSALLAGHLVVAPAMWLGYSLSSGEPSARFVVGTSAAEVSGCVHGLSTYARRRSA